MRNRKMDKGTYIWLIAVTAACLAIALSTRPQNEISSFADDSYEKRLSAVETQQAQVNNLFRQWDSALNEYLAQTTPAAPVLTVSPTSIPTPSTTPTPTQTPTRTMSPSTTPTAAFTPTPTPTIMPPGPTPTRWPTPIGEKPLLAPYLFAMLDWNNTDFASATPYLGTLGGWWTFRWDEKSNPAPGVYNFTEIDRYIETAANMPMAPLNGQVWPKQVGIAVQVYEFADKVDHWGEIYAPPWANVPTDCFDPDGSGPCKPFCTPKFQDKTWWPKFDAFIRALGAHLKQYNNVAFVIIATGVGTEGQQRINVGSCGYGTNEGSFDEWCTHLQSVYAEAMYPIPTFIQPSIHGLGGASNVAKAVGSQAGVKFNGTMADHPSAIQRVDGVLVGGAIGFALLNWQNIPVAFEPRSQPGIYGSYWLLMRTLSAHPWMMDWQIESLLDLYEASKLVAFPGYDTLLDFARQHIAWRTVQYTQDVWIVLYTTSYTDICWVGSVDGKKYCFGPDYEDWGYWMRRIVAPGYTAVGIPNERMALELPPAAWYNTIYGAGSCRRTDQASGNTGMAFDVDDAWPVKDQYTLYVTLADVGTDTFGVRYRCPNGKEELITFRKTGTGKWQTYVIPLAARFDNSIGPGADFVLDCLGDGNEYVHRIFIR